MPFKRTCFKLPHELGNVRGRSEREGIFLDVHLAIHPRPDIDLSQPQSMNAGNIGGSKAVIAVVETCQLFERADLLASFNTVQLALAGDAEEIFEDTVTRTRLKLVLVEIGRVVAIFMLQDSSSLS